MLVLFHYLHSSIKVSKKSFSSFLNTNFFLILVFALSAFIRFYQISQVPVSLYWDEIAVGYNAYSILHTGKDEYGNYLPVLFESYHDQKMPLFVYLSSVSIAFFGLNEFAVRFPSALFGLTGIVFLFFLIKELTNKVEKSKYYLALLSAFIFCITPWHIIFSRTGYEANIALTFLLSGLYFFVRGLNRSLYFLLSVICYVLACYTYRSSLLFASCILFFLITYFYKDLRKIDIKKIILLILFATILFLPLGLNFIQKGDERFSQVSIFSNQNESIATNVRKIQESGNSFIAKALFNRRMVYVNQFLTGYFSHFKPDFLFFAGDGNPRHGVKGMGVLYYWQLPFILIGIWYFLKHDRKLSFIMLGWLAISPISSSFAVPTPHALRALPMVIPFAAFTAGGIICILQILKSERNKYLFGIVLFFVLILNLSFFVKHYYIQNTEIANSQWGDGYKQLVVEVANLSDKYDKVVISGHYWQPYAYFLFYLKYDPVLYQKNGSSVSFDKYIFGGTDWDKSVGRAELNDVDLKSYANNAKKILVALSPAEYLTQVSHVTPIKNIKNHKGDVVFILAQVN